MDGVLGALKMLLDSKCHQPQSAWPMDRDAGRCRYESYKTCSTGLLPLGLESVGLTESFGFY